MNGQLAHAQVPKPPAAHCIIAFVFFMLLANVGAPVADPSFFLKPFASGPIDLLQSVALATASQVLQAFMFDHHSVVQSLIQTLASLWLLLLVIVAAILLQSRLKR
jgi:hypothetical protein